MPKKKTTPKKSPTKKSGRASKTTATPSKEKHDVTSKPLLDFQATHSEDFYAPSVWQAHQAFRHSEDQEILAWPGYQPNEEAWSHLMDFFRDLHLEDLQKALVASPLLMGHPLVLGQILHLRGLLQMLTIEQIQATETERLVYWHDIQHNPQVVATSMSLQTQAREAVASLLGNWIPGVLVSPCVVTTQQSKKPGPKPKVECEITTSGEMVSIPVLLDVVSDYEEHCEILAILYPEHLMQLEEYERPYFWTKDPCVEEPGKTQELTQRISDLLNDLLQASPYGGLPPEDQETHELSEQHQNEIVSTTIEFKPKPFLPQIVRCRLWDLFDIIEGPPVSRSVTRTKVTKQQFIPLSDKVVNEIVQKAKGKNAVNPEDLLYAFLAHPRLESKRYRGEIDQYDLDHQITPGAIQAIIDREKKKRRKDNLDISENPPLQSISLNYLLKLVDDKLVDKS